MLRRAKRDKLLPEQFLIRYGLFQSYLHKAGKTDIVVLSCIALNVVITLVTRFYLRQKERSRFENAVKINQTEQYVDRMLQYIVHDTGSAFHGTWKRCCGK